ncbi:5'-methylthioadenosine/adenosylhomocysteine nucleosidase [Propionimicrobium sp. PCR01-08-3]|uniref:5'-methylthioadenosine/adenosylhomocysteine nucleosidase n=1 Tax=Propionimicrobium sp. PCR01-08-3 TaxID=3052086 RepID=UPI00255C2A9E|nr:5'-methylthioadenosine/adenosylhomocysteine nucleosidase [Propionimicrobium sp. PCR01-08-3]WIY82515.1 5'-methylthioadenosine/adenosylhomocysteine nucleosidase [Propionimicrobium sp. PCR01-08-3]
MLAIIAALEDELSAIVAAARDEGEICSEKVAGVTLLHARLAGRDVLLTLSGVGKVAAATTAAVLAERASGMIHVGTAGGIGKDVNPGDIVIATELLQHDLDARPLWDRWVSPVVGKTRIPADAYLTAALAGAAVGAVAGHRAALASLGLDDPTVRPGLIISGDVFVNTAEGSAKLRSELPDALAVEMEGAAVAQVCAMAGIPFAVARTISDRADQDANVDFPAFLRKIAAPYARDLVVGALKVLD